MRSSRSRLRSMVGGFLEVWVPVFLPILILAVLFFYLLWF